MRKKLEIGKSYVTRDNAIVGPMKDNTSGARHYPVRGRVSKVGDKAKDTGYEQTGEWVYYTARGKFLIGSNRRDIMDLVSEVGEKGPPPPDDDDDQWPTAEEIDAKDLLGTGKRLQEPTTEDDHPIGPLTMAVDMSNGDLVISRKLVEYIDQCCEEIMRPNMNTQGPWDRVDMYKDMLKRSGDMAACIVQALSESRMHPSPEPTYGVESPETRALRDECVRVGRINLGMRQAYVTHLRDTAAASTEETPDQDHGDGN